MFHKFTAGRSPNYTTWRRGGITILNWNKDYPMFFTTDNKFGRNRKWNSSSSLESETVENME